MSHPRPYPRLVVFDCDGTLVDSEAAIVRSMQSAFTEHGLPPLTATEIRRRVGLSLVDFVLDLHPDLDRARAELVTAAYRSAFARHRSERGAGELFPGIRTVLKHLDDAGVLLGIATGKSRRGTLALLEGLGLRQRFATVQTADDAPSKPHPGMLLRALEETGSGPEETVFVGDTIFDVEAAVNAGVPAVGVAWGYHHPSELLGCGAARVVETAEELLEYLGSRASDSTGLRARGGAAENRRSFTRSRRR